MPCTLRPAHESDVSCLAALAAATFPDACPSFMPRSAIDAFIDENLSVDAFRMYLTGPTWQVRVAERHDGHAIVAYTLVDLAPTTSDTVLAATSGQGAAYLSKMYASQEVRGTGVAQALCRYTCAVLADQGQRFVWLGTHKGNGRANAFYARLGFEVIGERRFVVGGVEAEDWVYLGRASTARG